ncbi:solute carrier family 15 member 1-like [Belonocnema kinseyi]|uniref:solute carrier family 15 member 1-like n=1 Tax=Belonocnema kinseyi TaxID=2817044 RepID=UPI00143CF2C7|nr:solute carrier family 15 member 1-like [Belonocnema kinseyi]
MKYPRSIFLIIATEFCERLSFCGLRTILSLYLRNVLLFQENEATIIYHIFIMFCYLVPVIGAILADSFFGRFRTILYFSVVYIIGNILMCIAATPPISFWPICMTFIGLLFIASGTGGIKPCVAAFGGDQFHLPKEEKYLQKFFSIFYFTINFGGFLGMILIPALNTTITCFGDDTCYALGFGFPATLMIIALLLFRLGRPHYRLKYPKENIILSFFSCIFYAVKKSCKSRKNDEDKEHWLDNAQDKFPENFIADIKRVLAVLYLYIPLPLFWSLFDQQGSRWTFQASRMNGYIWGIQLLPDQIQVINPAIVLFLIPLFDKGIYPRILKNCKLHSSLNRMFIGGIFAGLAFVISGLLELKLEKMYPDFVGKGEASVNFINTLDCDIGCKGSFFPDFTLNKGEKKVVNLTAQNFSSYNVYIEAPFDCWKSELINLTLSTYVKAKELQVDTFLIGIVEKKIIIFETEPDSYSKSRSGRPKLRFIFMRDSNSSNNVMIVLKNKKKLEDKYLVPDGKLLSESAYIELEPGFLQYTISNGIDPGVSHQTSKKLDLGGVYIIVIRVQNRHVVFHKLFTMTPPNEIHMLWILPQYLLISIAEVMFAISGLEFSFTQAPSSMKTVTIAAWYVSVAMGNFLIIIVIQAHLFKSQANEFFLFAGLILLTMLIFGAMVRRYQFVLMEADSSVELFSVFLNREQEASPLIKVTNNKRLSHEYSVTFSNSSISTSSVSDS